MLRFFNSTIYSLILSNPQRPLNMWILWGSNPGPSVCKADVGVVIGCVLYRCIYFGSLVHITSSQNGYHMVFLKTGGASAAFIHVHCYSCFVTSANDIISP